MTDSGRYVFIVGCGRSGSTLVQRLIVESGQAVPVGELLFLDLLDRVSGLEKSQRPEALDAILENVSPDSVGSSRRALYAAAARALRSAITPHLAFLSFLSQAQQRAYRRPIVVHKTLSLGMEATVLAEQFPNARFIHVVRDGGDVAMSHVRLGWYPTYDDALQNWIQRAGRTAAQLRSISSNRVLVVRMEEIVRETAAREQVLQFACSNAHVVRSRTKVALPLPGDGQWHPDVLASISHSAVLSRGSQPLRGSALQLMGELGYLSTKPTRMRLDRGSDHEWEVARRVRQERAWVTLQESVAARRRTRRRAATQFLSRMHPLRS